MIRGINRAAPPRRHGDDPPFSVVSLYRGQFDRMLRLAVSLGAEEDADDLVAEAFYELYRQWSGLRDSNSAVGYLRATVNNLVRMHIRHKQVVRRYEQTLTSALEPARSTEDTVLRKIDHQAAIDALGALPPRQREAITLRFWMDLKDAEIADSMGISTGSVKVHIFRGMAGLRRAMSRGARDDQRWRAADVGQ